MSLAEGQAVELAIEKPAAGGRMIARHHGQIVLVRGAIPGPEWVWVPGHYRWQAGGYLWDDGHWDRVPRGKKHWERGHWRHDRRGWYWQDGRWR